MIAFYTFVAGLICMWPIAFCHGIDFARRRRWS